MLPSVLLVIIFWALVPGLLTGWMLRERGKKFWPGLLVGLVLGPFGVLAALAYIYVDDRRRAGRPGRAFRVFYDLPVVGRLHVSTVWMLAGVLTFVCVWVLGGLWYETYRGPRGSSGEGEQIVNSSSEKHLAQVPTRGGAQTTTPQEAPKSETAQKGSASPVPPSHLLGGLVGQPTQPPPGQGHVEGQNAPSGGSTASVSPGFSAPPPLNNAAAPGPQPTQAPPQPAPPAPTAHARDAAVSEVARALAAAGHKVHASVSGDAQTATLSLSGATLTRGAGNQVIGGRLRHSLKAAGVRIVVMVNGQESWTYML